KEAQEEARRSAGRKTPPQGQGRAEGAETGREAKGQGGKGAPGQCKSNGKRQAEAEWQGEWGCAERPFPERACRQKRYCKIQYSGEAQAGPREPRVGVGPFVIPGRYEASNPEISRFRVRFARKDALNLSRHHPAAPAQADILQ